MRREQRDITMRDLQKAVKYGTRRRSRWKERWTVEYDGIIFVTDESMRKVITSYPSPLAEAPITTEQQDQHNKTKQVVDHKPELCSTHTVLVVDNSGSMTTHDIDLYRCRQTAAYTMTALEFVAEQIFNGTANNRDLFSLVEFSKTSQVVFRREPLSWVLYNKILTRRDTRTFEKRQADQTNDMLYSNSNYLPALEKAKQLLAEGNHETCALNMYFLSDGAPTDARELGITPHALKRKLLSRVHEIATEFGKQLNVQLVGFGSGVSDFTTLRDMAQAINAAPGEAKAEFLFCDKMANQMRTAASSLIASSTLTRTSLMEDHHHRARKTVRNLTSELETAKGRPGLSSQEWTFYRIREHYVLDPRRRHFVTCRGIPDGALRSHNRPEAKRRERNPPRFLAMRTGHCGVGAERVAFRCHLSEQDPSADRSPLVPSSPPQDVTQYFAFDAMVAKETKLVERVEENVAFHKAFCETQDLAQYLANEFNKRLQGLPGYDKDKTPKISFLPCSVLVVHDPEWPKGERGLLVEKKLDTDKFPWCKWNDNAGGVNGSVAPIDVDLEWAKLRTTRQQQQHSMRTHPQHLPMMMSGHSNYHGRPQVSLGALSLNQGNGFTVNQGSMGAIIEEEGDSEDEEDDEEDDDDRAQAHHQYGSLSHSRDPPASVHRPASSLGSGPTNHKSALASLSPSHYLQAFTHFTYMYTSKKVMVCDLQGVYNTDTVPPTFELSDPAIHYASSRGREMVYGRTDKGKEGMQLFNNTHECNCICKFLQLSKHNKHWRKHWHRDRDMEEDNVVPNQPSLYTHTVPSSPRGGETSGGGGGWPEAALGFFLQRFPFLNSSPSSHRKNHHHTNR